MSITGEPLREYLIAQFVEDFWSIVEEDDFSHADYVRTHYHALHQDEQLEVNNRLRKMKSGRRQLNTLLKDYLNYYGET